MRTRTLPTSIWLALSLGLGLYGCGKESAKKKDAPKKAAPSPTLRAPLEPPALPPLKVADRPHRAPLDLKLAPTGSVGQPLDRYPLGYRKAMALLDAYEGNSVLLLEARKLARKLRDDPKSGRRAKALAHVALGRVSYKAGFRKVGKQRPANLVRAEKHFDRALRLQPGLFEALLLKGHAHLFAGELKKARAVVARATRRRRGSVDLYSLRAAIAARANKPDEVIRLEKELLAKTKHRWLRRSAYTRLASTYARLKKPAKAEAAYVALLKLVPDSVWANLGYAAFSINIGRYDVALKHARKALSLMDFPAAHRIYAQACFAKGRHLLWKKKRAPAAWAYFRRASKHAPRNPDVYHGIGKALEQVARLKRSLWALDQAGVALRKALKLAPKHALSTKALAEYQAGYAQAKRWIESAAKKP